MPRYASFSRAPLGLAFLAMAVTVAAPVARPVRAASDDVIPPQAQSAADRGLEWLASQQRPNGSFPGSPEQSTAVTSLAVLAFLARGHNPGEGPYAEQINLAIDWVLKQQRPNGLLSPVSGNHAMYDHGISTVMLCEAYGMVNEARQQKIQSAVASAVKLILDAQRVAKPGQYAGGWRYTPDATDSDISVTGWQLMALRGAANIGAAVPQRAIQAGIAYITGMASPSGGFGYTSNNDVSSARTGTGVLSLELLGQHLTRPAIAGGDYLLSHPVSSPRQVSFYYYAVYYVSQAANQLGGKHWPGIYIPLRDGLIACQSVNGSWNSNLSGEGAGDVYATSMAILGLCVPYRYLPLYQR